MTQKTNLKILLGALAVAASLAANAAAQSTTNSRPAETAADTGRGLLGQSYVNLGYSYTDVHDSSTDLQSLRLEYNLPLNRGFDLNLGYTGARTSEFAGIRQTQQSIDANAVAFLPGLGWGRPYLSAGAGWLWLKTGGTKNNSFIYQFETGVEFQPTTVLSVTPFVKYLDASSVHINNHWAYGVKANYWLTDRWAVNAGVALDNKVDASYGVGIAYRF